MVLLNHCAAAVEATQRLIREGHKRIALLTGPLKRKNHIVRAGEQALSGYKEVLSGHSIPFDPSLIKTREHSAEAGYSVMEEFLSSPEGPTAFLIYSSPLTAGARKFIREGGESGRYYHCGILRREKESNSSRYFGPTFSIRNDLLCPSGRIPGAGEGIPKD